MTYEVTVSGTSVSVSVSGSSFAVSVSQLGSGAPSLADITDWPSEVSAAEVGYLDGVTSPIQEQLEAKAASSHTHTLSDVTDAGAMAALAEATADQVRALANSALGITTRRARDAAALITPSGSANWTPDWEAFVSADWSVTANRTLGNPTNVIPGTTRVVKIRSSSSTARTISWGSNFKGNIPTATVTDSAFLFVTLTAISSTEIVVSHLEYT